MHIEISHRFEGAELTQIEQLYMQDEVFNQQVFSDQGVRRRVVQHERRGELLVRTLRLCPLHALPAPFSALLRGGVFYICEHVEYDLGQHRGRWQTHPSLLGHQFKAAGSFSFERDERGVTFHLEGEAHASIPLLSRRAEKQAVHTAEQQHAALADAVRARLSGPSTASSAA